MNMANCEVFRLPSDGMTGRTTAYLRLKFITAADRSAVPCGRWVRRIRPLVETQFLVGLAMTAIKYPYLRTAEYRRGCKPRWRLEYRR